MFLRGLYLLDYKLIDFGYFLDPLKGKWGVKAVQVLSLHPIGSHFEDVDEMFD
jgi:hypothetical protein